MVVFGGATASDSLAKDDLYLLEIKEKKNDANWVIIPVSGEKPGRRYGHTIVFKSPNLILFGGNNGKKNLNDVWTLNIRSAPSIWRKIDIKGPCPQPRCYHSAAICP